MSSATLRGTVGVLVGRSWSPQREYGREHLGHLGELLVSKVRPAFHDALGEPDGRVDGGRASSIDGGELLGRKGGARLAAVAGDPGPGLGGHLSSRHGSSLATRVPNRTHAPAIWHAR